MEVPEQLYRLVTANRLTAADFFESLSTEQLATPSLCDGWTVRDILAHLVHPLTDDMRMLTTIRTLISYRGNTDKIVQARTAAAAALPTEQLIATLRERADLKLDPPFTHAYGPLADSCIHLRDAARPVGSDAGPSLAAWRAVLDYLPGGGAARVFAKPSLFAGLRLEADDQDWAHGEGDLVTGSSEALTLALTGRDVALADLSGPGLPVLTARIAG